MKRRQWSRKSSNCAGRFETESIDLRSLPGSSNLAGALLPMEGCVFRWSKGRTSSQEVGIYGVGEKNLENRGS